MGIGRRVITLLRGVKDDAAPAGPAQVPDTVRSEIDYLQFEVSRLRSIVRHLAADRINTFPIERDTRDSFDYQWSDTPDGDWTKSRPELKERERNSVRSFSRLPDEWFEGKQALDAGCGSGRWSWALASLGCAVTAVDQSMAGVQHTKAACSEFASKVRGFQHDLTKPLPLADRSFDLVWSFGVLHHTGDTYGSFRNIARLVKPGGYIFLMLYAEPNSNDPGGFDYYVEVERLRRATAGMDLKQRYDYIERVKGPDAGGWFDAASPGINDTYSLHEIETWLWQEGFREFGRADHPNHHIVARLLQPK